MLRREGYSGRVTLLSADASLPCAPESVEGYLAAARRGVEPASGRFLPGAGHRGGAERPCHRHRPEAEQLRLADGSDLGYDALLLATGAEPVHLDVPGSDRPHVHYLRTLADSRALVTRAKTARRAVVIGASFIGLEVASSLRARDIEVHIVGREAVPMERILGPEAGQFIRNLHEGHGVSFHLGTTATRIDERSVSLANGQTLPADLVVIGVGVRPATALAQEAGLAVDRGVLVNEYLETSVPGIFAAGDIARWPDPLSGEPIRVEHWVVAQRQGQTAARNMLGRQERFDAVPFFWTEQYDFGLAYVGHAERFDRVEVDGSVAARDCTLAYWRDGRKLAVAVVHRDLEGLRAEVQFERGIAASAGAAGEVRARTAPR